MSISNPNTGIVFSGPPLQTPLVTADLFATTAFTGWLNKLYVRVGALPVIRDTRANRVNYPAANFLGAIAGLDVNHNAVLAAKGGMLYYETDTKLWYMVAMVASVPTWTYVLGTAMFTTLAALAAFAVGPPALTIADTGLLAYESQYQHIYQWSGTAWAFGPGDDHMAGQIAASGINAAPRGGVWHSCDGAAVAISKGDATAPNVTVPALNSALGTFLVGLPSQGAVQVATQPTWDAAARTDDEAAPAGGPHTHGVAIPPTTVQSGSGATAGSSGVFPTTTPTTPNAHALTNANAKLNPPSIASHGLPQYLGLVWYIRQ